MDSSAAKTRELRRTYLLLARRLRRNVNFGRSSWNAYATGAAAYRRVAKDLRHV